MIYKILPLQFIRKAPLHGSEQEMRYRLCRKEEELELCVYPGPFGFDQTPESDKQYFSFPFSEEGYDQALDQLQRCYSSTNWKDRLLDWKQMVF